MHFSSASSWKMLSSSGEFVFQSAWKGTLRLSRDSDTLILSASSRPFLTRYLRRLEKGEARDSRWLPREGEKLPFFFFRGTPHDAHGLIALHGVTRSYFLPFYAVSRREMFVSSVGRRQPRATPYRWFGVSSRALSFYPKASRYSFQVARASCRNSLKAASTLPPWVTKRALQTLGLEGEKSFSDNVITIAVCSGKIWLIDEFVDLLYAI